MLEIRRYSRELYERLETETGQPTGFAPVGFIEVALGVAELFLHAFDTSDRAGNVHHISALQDNVRIKRYGNT